MRFLRLTYEFPLEQVGFAQAAMISLGGTAIAVELIENVERFPQASEQRVVTGPVIQATGTDTPEGRRQTVVSAALDEIDKANGTARLKSIIEATAAKGVNRTTTMYYVSAECEAGRLKRVASGTYGRGKEAGTA